MPDKIKTPSNNVTTKHKISDPHATSHSTGKTTVVIITHNYGRYLAWCIHSVFTQTLKPCRVIVVDDASEDNTKEIVAPFIPQVEYYRVEYRNAQQTRNYGLAKVSTEYVIFLDADDYMADSMIEQLESALDLQPQLRLAYCDKYVFGDQESIRSLNLPYYWQADDFSLQLLQFRNFIMFPSLVRRKFLTTFDIRICRLQDWDTWLGILESDEHAIRIPVPLLHYRAHGNNLSLNRKELIERLKILAKHSLIESQEIQQNSRAQYGFSRSDKVVVFLQCAEIVDFNIWQTLSQNLGCKIQVIVGTRLADDKHSDNYQQNIERGGNTVVQIVTSDSLDDLLWRHTAAATSSNVATVVVLSDIKHLASVGLFQKRKGSLYRSILNLDDTLSTESLEELGAFSLSPSATRQLLYLQPATPQTISNRLYAFIFKIWTERIAWRFSH